MYRSQFQSLRNYDLLFSLEIIMYFMSHLYIGIRNPSSPNPGYCVKVIRSLQPNVNF